MKIEKDREIHAIPEREVKHPPAQFHYPFREMGKGESFTIPREDQGRVSMIASALTRYTDASYITRKIDDQTSRVWRIK